VSFQFKPAIRESVGLIVGLAGGTGSGKTFSALKLATGMAGGKPFALIDTEAGRARHYADQFKFDHGDLAPPFRPQRYAEAIFAADAAQYPVIVVDSMSHEWSSDGGILDWQEEELERMAGDDWKKRESCRMASWIKPKMDHKKMVQRLLQIRAHLILCFRAEEKIEMTKVDGEWKVQPKKSLVGLSGWIPVCEKALPYELTASFLLTADAPGIPKPIKLQEQHRGFFPLDRPISEQSGRDLAAWAKGAPAASTARLSDGERDAHLKALETAESMPLLQAAFEGAWKAAARDGELRRLFKSMYDAALKKFSQGATANA
jgi:AAA domain